MFWVIFISVIWAAAFGATWYLFTAAAKIRERDERETRAFIDRLTENAESQGMPDDNKPHWLEQELLTSRRRLAHGIWGGRPRKYLDS